MNDDERQQVGIRYKEQGQEQAISLGHELVSNEIKSQRIAGWLEFAQQHPNGALYCFRGGLRSRITQQWIYAETGISYPRVTGGYKALRRFLIDELDRVIQQLNPFILGGRTGTGKTLLLNNIHQQVDLEAVYHHRGSAFGRHATPQPSQIDIENNLTVCLMKHLHQKHESLVFEDEGCNIGSRKLPRNFYKKMCQSPLIILETNDDQRVTNVFQEYITESVRQYQDLLGPEKGFENWAQQLLISLDKIERRLGGVRHKQLKQAMLDAIQTQRDSGDAENHKEWIKTLLLDYYDPMYDYQLDKKSERVIFRGDQTSVLEYLATDHNIN
jgi:tRNA 2-selenouridine synthase